MIVMECLCILCCVVEILCECNDELVYLEILDIGKVLVEIIIVDIVIGVDVVEYYVGLVIVIEGIQLLLCELSFFYICCELLGVVVGIGVWNYLIQIVMWKLVLVLVVGNVMVFKFFEVILLIVIKLVEIYIEVGVLVGVFNVVQGLGCEIGQWLIEYLVIEKIFFIGGVVIGKKVMVSVVFLLLKEVIMELGGKLLLVICDDVDLDCVVDIVVMVNFFSFGQVCINGICVFVLCIMLVVFEVVVVECVKCICIGDLMVVEINFGLLISFLYMENVLCYIESGKVEGVCLLIGGGCVIEGVLVNGVYVLLIVFFDCCDDMIIVKEEIFGLVMSIFVYDDEDEVVCCVNDIIFGFVVGVVSKDISCVYCIIYCLEVGICWINIWGELLVEMLVGGYKEFGVGCENGIFIFGYYICIKLVQVELGDYVSVF